MKLFVYLSAYFDNDTQQYETNVWLATDREYDYLDVLRIAFDYNTRELYVTFDDKHVGFDKVMDYHLTDHGEVIKNTYVNGNETTVVFDATKFSAFTFVQKGDDMKAFIGTKSWLKKLGITRASDIINECLGLKPISDDFELIDQPVCSMCIRETCKECPIFNI